jgi:hypothetical protein
MGGKFDTDVTAMLKEGYKQVSGVVNNALYTLESDGSNLTIVLNADVMKDESVNGYLPNVKALALEIAADLALNNLTCAALSANGTIAKMVFSAASGGGYPVTEGVTPIKIMSLATSKTAGATDAQLVADRAEGAGMVTLGFTAVVHKNYAAGKDLIVVFLKDESLVKKTQAPLLYDGKLMHEITTGNYNINGDRYFCIFGYITENADPALVTKDNASKPTMCPEIKYSNDVNLTGAVDINDAQAIANIYNGKMALEGNETKWFRADINRDGKVDINDRNALMNTLNK